MVLLYHNLALIQFLVLKYWVTLVKVLNFFA